MVIAYYADPYERRPIWRAREDDGRSHLFAKAPHTAPSQSGDLVTALTGPIKVLDRHLLIFRVSGKPSIVTPVYVSDDDGEAHWQVFLLVATVGLMVAIKALVEQDS